MKKLETIVTLIQKPTEVEFTCPYCKSDISENFEEFLDEQGLSWSDFPDWEYEPIKCPFCENEIEAEYEFDWGGGMNQEYDIKLTQDDMTIIADALESCLQEELKNYKANTYTLDLVRLLSKFQYMSGFYSQIKETEVEDWTKKNEEKRRKTKKK